MGVAVPETADEPSPAPVAIWPENHQAVRLFLVAQTQWRTESGKVLALDYTGVKAAADMAGLAVDADTLMDLQVLETEAAKLLNERGHG